MPVEAPTAIPPTSDEPSAPIPLDDSTNPSTLPDRPPPPPLAPQRYHPTLYFDPHWLSIVKTFAPYLSLRQQQIAFPPPASFDKLISESLDWIQKNVGEAGLKKVDDVQVFARTAPATGEGREDGPRELPFRLVAWTTLTPHCPPASWYTNPQTEAFCDMIGIPNQINPVPAGFKEAQEKARVEFEIAEAAAVKERAAAKAQALKEAREEALKMVDDVPEEDSVAEAEETLSVEQV